VGGVAELKLVDLRLSVAHVIADGSAYLQLNAVLAEAMSHDVRRPGEPG